MPLIRHELARNRRSEQNDSSINHQATKFGNCESAAFTRRLSLGRRSSITHRYVTMLPGFVNGDNAMFRADDNGHFQRGSTQTGRRRSIRESGSALQARVRARCASNMPCRSRFVCPIYIVRRNITRARVRAFIHRVVHSLVIFGSSGTATANGVVRRSPGRDWYRLPLVIQS